VEFALSPSVHDGRFANNPWLQETPQPITKLTWDNAALVSVETARQLGVSNEDLVEIQIGNRRARSPILIVPGHAEDCLTLQLGYGRSGAESLAASAGFNVYPLRTSGSLALAGGAQIHKVGRYRLATTQEHFTMMGRDLAVSSTAAEYRRDPKALTERLKEPQPSLLPEVEYQGQQWAMTIDLSLCTGCSACTMACYTENNNHIVGKAEVLHHREMDWLRIDTYFDGDPRDPGMVHQPMMCQHCEKAPCEYVCPVNATEHSPDGLNEMVYNRCVGTRFCSNNCPYKVRRFNWYDWSERIKFNQGLVQLHQNPDVTVRERGVMEKCTYCVQRIREEEIHASIEKREMGPVQSACQQACPTRAIQFGSLAQKDSDMVRWRQQERSYAVLHDQNTAPRTMYLARINNPNPDLE
jgi:Fe-S-cluster-containing dehydrogenase component